MQALLLLLLQAVGARARARALATTAPLPLALPLQVWACGWAKALRLPLSKQEPQVQAQPLNLVQPQVSAQPLPLERVPPRAPAEVVQLLLVQAPPLDLAQPPLQPRALCASALPLRPPSPKGMSPCAPAGCALHPAIAAPRLCTRCSTPPLGSL